MSHSSTQGSFGGKGLVHMDGVEVPRCLSVEVDVFLTDISDCLGDGIPGVEALGARFLVQIGRHLSWHLSQRLLIQYQSSLLQEHKFLILIGDTDFDCQQTESGTGLLLNYLDSTV